MIQYKSEVNEIIIARFTHFPNPDEIEAAWFNAKRAKEVGKSFPKRNLAWRAKPQGYEFYVTKA